jgi:hypothetical protein
VNGRDDLDMPFEEQAATPMPDEHQHIASGLVIMAGVVPVPDHGPMPCRVYRFAIPDGSGFYPPIVLVVDADQMAKLAQLTAAASATAIQSAAAT